MKKPSVTTTDYNRLSRECADKIAPILAQYMNKVYKDYNDPKENALNIIELAATRGVTAAVTISLETRGFI